MTDSPTNEDFINMGHLALAQGNKSKAIDFYKQSINNDKTEIDKLIISLRDDEKHLLKMGVDVSLMPFIVDALLYSIE